MLQICPIAAELTNEVGTSLAREVRNVSIVNASRCPPRPTVGPVAQRQGRQNPSPARPSLANPSRAQISEKYCLRSTLRCHYWFKANSVLDS